MIKYEEIPQISVDKLLIASEVRAFFHLVQIGFLLFELLEVFDG